jgi:hypothetical protein
VHPARRGSECPSFHTVFPRLSVQWTALEDRDSISLQSKGWACLWRQCLPLETKAGLLPSHKEQLWFRKVRVPHLQHSHCLGRWHLLHFQSPYEN